MCGTTDSEKRFHEYLINICTTETDADFAFMFRAIINALFVHHDKFEYKPNCLIADAAPAFHNGFMAAFEYTS